MIDIISKTMSILIPTNMYFLSLLLLLTDTALFCLMWNCKDSRLKCRINHSGRLRTSSFPHDAFIAVQPVPGELGTFLISEIVDNSRSPSDRISVLAPCWGNLAPAERDFSWFLLSSHSQCLSAFEKEHFYFTHEFFFIFVQKINPMFK